MTIKAEEIESNVAFNLLRKLEESIMPVCAVMDEAASLGFQVVWDGILMQPNGHHQPTNLRLVRTYKR